MVLHALAALLVAALASQAAAQDSSASFYGWATPYGGHTVRTRDVHSCAIVARPDPSLGARRGSGPAIASRTLCVQNFQQALHTYALCGGLCSGLTTHVCMPEQSACGTAEATDCRGHEHSCSESLSLCCIRATALARHACGSCCKRSTLTTPALILAASPAGLSAAP